MELKKMLSPSSINLYNHCPRKYYYNYIEKLPTKPNIYLVRGKLVHTILEEFFSLGIELLEEDKYEDKLLAWILHLFKKHWNNNLNQIKALTEKEEAEFYEHDTKVMLLNWVTSFSKKIGSLMKKGDSFASAFKKLTPKTEMEYVSEEYNVKGFMDTVEEIEGKTRIMDYKTSDRMEVGKAYKLQLAIYALLYKENHKKLPDYVGINFLRGEEVVFEVNEEMLDYAKNEIENIRKLTSSNNIEAYKRDIGPLCKWNGGQCDFFDVCKPFEKENKN